MSNVQTLPYASAPNDEGSVRLPGLLATWFLVTGVVGAALLLTDLLLNRRDSQLAILLDWRRFSDQWRVSLSAPVWTLNFCARSLAGVLLLATAIHVHRRRGLLSPLTFRYIRVAGVLMVVNLLGEFVQIMDAPAPARMPMAHWLWTLTAVASAALMLPQAWILLVGSVARFYRDAEFVRRLVGLSAALAGLLVSLVFAEYVIRWLLGTPPPWMTAQGALIGAGARPFLSRLGHFMSQATPWLYFASALVALVTGLLILLSRAPRNWYLVALAVGWIMPRALWLLTSMIFTTFGRARWISILNEVLSDCFFCLLSVVACWLAGRVSKPDVPIPTP
jgi:hypothetical protein